MVKKSGVEFVITAKNDGAVKVFQNLTTLLKTLGAETKISDKASADLASTLTSVGGQLSKIKQAVGGESAGDLIAKEMTSARIQTLLLGKAASESALRLAGLHKDLEEVRTNLKAVRAELKAGTPEFDKQAEKVGELEKELAKLAKRETTLKNQKEALLSKQRQQNAVLEQSSTLTEKQIQKEKQALALTTAKINANDQERGSTNALHADKLADYQKESAILTEITNKRTRLRGLEGGYSDNEGRLATQYGQLRGQVQDKAGKRDTAERELDRLELAAAETDEELLKVSKTLNTTLKTAQAKAATGTRELHGEWKKLEKNTQMLSEEMRGLKNPTEQQVASFKRSAEAAKTAKLAYQSNIATLKEYKTLLRQPAGIPGGAQAQYAQAQALLGKVNDRTDITKQDPNIQGANRQIENTRRAHLRTTHAVRQHARAQTELQKVMAKFYGNNRVQLSVLQRLRTELHSLALAYGGFFAIFRGVGSVVESIKTIEKAQNRLRTVVGNDARLIGQELDFVRRNAKRLGIEFGLLSNEYTKFSIATKNTNLQGKHTRDIFLSMAEAARVNGADNEALSGAFLALTQIVSKGTVTMEELKRQLGDRVAGAVHIMADALGVGTAELFKMVEAGEVTSDALIKFADEMDNRFGPGLSKALQSTQAQIGRLQHSLFQMQLRIARSDFIDAFNGLLASISEVMASPEFNTFTDRIGTGLSVVAGFIGLVVENFRNLVAVSLAFAALKLAPIVAYLGTRVLILGNAFGKLQTAQAIYNLHAAQGATRMLSLGRAIKFLRASAGGWATILSIAAAALGHYFGQAITDSTDANEIMGEHERVMDRISNAWDKSAGSVKKFADELRKIPGLGSQTNAIAARDLVAQSIAKARKVNRKETHTDALQEKYGFLPDKNAADVKVMRDFIEEALNTAESGTLQDRRAAAQNFEEDFWKKAIDSGLTKDGVVIKEVSDLFNDVVPLVGDALEHSIAEIVERLRIQIDAESKKFDALEKRLKNGNFTSTHETLGTITFNENTIKALRADAARKLEEISAIALDDDNKPEDLTDRMNKLRKSVEGFTLAANKSAADLKRDKSFGGLSRQAQKLNEEIKSLREGYPRHSREWNELGEMGRRVMDAQTDSLKKLNAEWVKSVFGSAPKVDFGGAFALLEGVTEKVINLTTELKKFKVLSDQLNARSSLFGDLEEQDQGVILAAIQKAREKDRTTDKNATGAVNLEKSIMDALFSLDDDKLRTALQAVSPEFGAGLSDRALERAKIVKEINSEEYKKLRAQFLAAGDEEFAIAKAEQFNPLHAAGMARRKEFASTPEGKEATPAELKQAYDQGYLLAKFQADNSSKKGKEEDPGELLQKAAQALIDEKGYNEDLFYSERPNVARGELLTDDKLSKFRDTFHLLTEKEIPAAIDAVLEYYRALQGDDSPENSPQTRKIIAEFELLKEQNKLVTDEIKLSWEEVAGILSNSLSSGVDKFIEQIYKTEKGFESLGVAFRQFLSDFLIGIGKAIQQQATLGIANSIIGLVAPGFNIQTNHAGGLAGYSNASRSIPVPRAIEYHHNGGIAGGLRSNEVLSVLEKGEEVLPASDKRHVRNGGKSLGEGGGASPVSVTTIVVGDRKKAMDKYFDTPEGKNAVVKIVNDEMGG